MQYIKAPYHVATSSTAKRTYIGTFLFVSASLVLLVIAAAIYPVFYYSYIPKKLITLPIHLQYNVALNPYGVIPLSSDLMLEQAYDVTVELTLPRSPTNLNRGNFMIALYAMSSVPTDPGLAFAPSADPHEHVTPDTLVFSSRRPVLLPYTDPLVSMVSRVVFLLYHIIFPRTSEIITLSVPMGEMVQFRGPRPQSILVDIEAGQTLQVYSSTVTLVARLTGVRWFMYNHRLLSFVVCTAVFWFAELASTVLVWFVLGWLPTDDGGRAIMPKDEDDKSEDTPTKEYEWSRAIKSEDDDVFIKEEESPGELEKLYKPHMGSTRLPGDADDEDYSDEYHQPSRPGTTGFGSGKDGGQVRRRTSRAGSS